MSENRTEPRESDLPVSVRRKSGSSDSCVLRCDRLGNVWVPKGVPRLLELEQRNRSLSKRLTYVRKNRMNRNCLCSGFSEDAELVNFDRSQPG